MLPRLPHLRRLGAALAATGMLIGLLAGLTMKPAAADVTSVTGSACPYYVNVGLFGGPQNFKGCGAPGVPTTDQSYSPKADLPSAGGSLSLDDDTCPPATPCSPGAKANYGPATINGGIWPENVNSPTPSGPQHASTSGTIGAGGSVTSSASITLDAQPYPQVPCTPGFSPLPGDTGCRDPGGFGPPPVWGDSVLSTCSASETGGVSGDSTFSNAFYATATDSGGSPLPNQTFPIPQHPAVNESHSGVITNVGDVFTVVLNQQIVHPDGSLTVNAVHMYLFGPTAVGELVRGSVTCGTTPTSATSSDTVAPSCGTPVVKPMGPTDPTPQVPRSELVGTFDAGNGTAGSGVTISNVQSNNATVSVGSNPPSSFAYLNYTPGQIGPLPITATRTDEAFPMSWSFDATDAAGNVSHCSGAGSPGPTEFSVADLFINEGNSGSNNATFFVTRSGDNNKVSKVTVHTAGGNATAGSDYTAVSNTVLTFNPGEVTVPVPVPIIGDTNTEKDETFNLVLSAQTNAALADSTGTATIVNDDAPAFLNVADIVVPEGNSGPIPATFTVTRSGNLAQTSTVSVKTAGGTATAGTDYNAVAPTVITFNPGDTAVQVSPTVIGDTLDENNETFTLALSGAVGATVSDTAATATIVDDDGPVVAGPATFLTIGDLSVTEGNSGPTAANFTVTRSGDVSAAGTVKYTTGGGTATGSSSLTGVPDYTSVPAGTLLNFAAGQSTATVSVDVTGDTLPEASETFNVTLSAPTTGTVLSDAAATATIVNDDGYAYLTVNNISGSEGNSGTTPFTFTITRSGNASGVSTVKVATSGGTATGGGVDYTSIPAGTVVSFAAGQTTATVPVNVIGDTTIEPSETFNLVLSSSVGATISDSSATATIINDDLT